MVEFVLVILALLLAGMGVLALGAVRSGRSLRGELVFRAVLPLLKRSAQRQAATADGGEPILAPAPPPARIARRYDIRQTDGDGTISIMRRGQSAGRYVLYVHGGAYILPLMPQHWPILAALAEQVPATVVAPDYPLAPANDCQPAFAMMDALYDWSAPFEVIHPLCWSADRNGWSQGWPGSVTSPKRSSPSCARSKC